MGFCPPADKLIGTQQLLSKCFVIAGLKMFTVRTAQIGARNEFLIKENFRIWKPAH